MSPRPADDEYEDDADTDLDSSELEEAQLTPEEAAELEEARLAGERGYFKVSRSFSVGLLALLPLLIVYEAGMIVFRAAPNAVGNLIKTPISWLRHHPTDVLGMDLMLALNAVALAAVLLAFWRVKRKGALHAGTFVGMLIESALYAPVSYTHLTLPTN